MFEFLNSYLYSFFYLIGLLGEPITWLFIGTIELVVFFSLKKELRTKLKVISLEVFSTIFVSTAIISTLKQFFKIPRPCVGQPFCPLDFSFPSGHSSAAFAVFVFLAFNTKNMLYRTIFIASAFVVAYSRIYLGVHTIVDVAVGALIGTVIGIIISLILKVDKGKRKSTLFEMLKFKKK